MNIDIEVGFPLKMTFVSLLKTSVGLDSMSCTVGVQLISRLK